MLKHYILVDYENTQPQDIPDWRPGACKLLFFTGQNQKLPVKLVERLQALGGDISFITMNGGGKNALDFFIAFYLGRLTAEDRNVNYYILSKDSGFDPLISYLRDQGSKIRRVEEMEKIPLPKKTAATHFSNAMCNKYYTEISLESAIKTNLITPPAEDSQNTPIIQYRNEKEPDPKTKAVVENIRKRKSGRPGSITALQSTIKSLCGGQCSKTEEGAIIDYLMSQKMITVSETSKITYNC